MTADILIFSFPSWSCLLIFTLKFDIPYCCLFVCLFHVNYPLSLKAINPKSKGVRAMVPPKAWGKILFLASSSSWWIQAILGLWQHCFNLCLLILLPPLLFFVKSLLYTSSRDTLTFIFIGFSTHWLIQDNFFISKSLS